MDDLKEHNSKNYSLKNLNEFCFIKLKSRLYILFVVKMNWIQQTLLFNYSYSTIIVVT